MQSERDITEIGLIGLKPNVVRRKPHAKIVLVSLKAEHILVEHKVKRQKFLFLKRW